MAATTRPSIGQAGARWLILLRPRWLAWHSFVIVATVGMLLLGDWQLHRAESGNQLSWAYTFEWPLFAAFTVYFWIKSLRDELRDLGAGARAESKPDAAASGVAAPGPDSAAPDAAASGSSPAATAVSAASVTASQAAAGTNGSDPVTTARPAGKRAASWDATSWDATNWDPAGAPAGASDPAKPVDLARATPADGEAYVARLMAEVQRPGRRRGGR